MVGPVGPTNETPAPTSTPQTAPRQGTEPAAAPQAAADAASVAAKVGKVPAEGAFERVGKAADGVLGTAVDTASAGIDAVANASKKVLQKIKEKPWVLTPPGALYEIFQGQKNAAQKAQDAVNNILNQLKDPEVLEKAGIGKPLTLETLNPEAHKKLQEAIDQAVKDVAEALKTKPAQIAADAAKTAAEITLLAVAPAVGLTAAAAKKLAEVVANQEKK